MYMTQTSYSRAGAKSFSTVQCSAVQSSTVQYSAGVEDQVPTSALASSQGLMRPRGCPQGLLLDATNASTGIAARKAREHGDAPQLL